MPRSRPKFRLFDLVMWVTLAGIVLAFLREISRIPFRRDDESHGPVIFICLLFGIWFTVWRYVRGKRTGPVCQQCGRRFLADGVLANSLLCARCRQASLPQAQSQRELTVTFLGIIFGLTIVMSVVCLPLWTSLVARFGGFAWLVHPLLALGATLGLLAAIFVVMAVFFTLRNWSMRYEKPILALARKVTRSGRNRRASRPRHDLVVRLD